MRVDLEKMLESQLHQEFASMVHKSSEFDTVCRILDDWFYETAGYSIARTSATDPTCHIVNVKTGEVVHKYIPSYSMALSKLLKLLEKGGGDSDE